MHHLNPLKKISEKFISHIPFFLSASFLNFKEVKNKHACMSKPGHQSIQADGPVTLTVLVKCNELMDLHKMQNRGIEMK